MDLQQMRDEIIRVAARHGAGAFGCSVLSHAAKIAREATSICWSTWTQTGRSALWQRRVINRRRADLLRNHAH